MLTINNNLQSFNEQGNDYRYVFTKEEVDEINKALKGRADCKAFQKKVLHLIATDKSFKSDINVDPFGYTE